MNVDVIIPVKNTGPCWRESLDSFYREIPINRLLIGLPLWTCIVYLIYRLILMAIPFVGG